MFVIVGQSQYPKQGTCQARPDPTSYKSTTSKACQLRSRSRAARISLFCSKAWIQSTRRWTIISLDGLRLWTGLQSSRIVKSPQVQVFWSNHEGDHDKSKESKFVLFRQLPTEHLLPRRRLWPSLRGSWSRTSPWRSPLCQMAWRTTVPWPPSVWPSGPAPAMRDTSMLEWPSLSVSYLEWPHQEHRIWDLQIFAASE